MLDLVGNPEDWFSQFIAHMTIKLCITFHNLLYTDIFNIHDIFMTCSVGVKWPNGRETDSEWRASGFKPC